jgi:Rod binding domain-containing protein
MTAPATPAMPLPLAATGETTARPAAPDRLREAAEAFEAFFIAQYLEHMSSGLKADGPFDGGQAEENWRSVLNQEFGKAVARRNGIGIADTVYREMLKLQEVAE